MPSLLRCAVLDDYQGAALASADWTPLAGRVEVTVFSEPLGGPDDVVAALAPYDVVVLMRERTPFPAAVVGRLPALRLIVTTGMRNASLDVAAATASGVTVCGTASSAGSTVELTWALILALARQLRTEDAAMRSDGPWQSTVGTDLAGSTLGLLGLGRIGAQVAAIGRAFGMDVVAWSSSLTDERTAEVGVRRAATLADLLRQSDFASVHVVLGDRTRGLLGAAELAAMKPTAYLVNTSRGPIVDTDALVAALTAGQLAGAGLDVFDTEPLPAGHPLRRLPTVLATPHLGYVTRGNYRSFFTEIVADITAWLDGAPVRRL